MFCYKCGNKIPDDSKFCPECGTKFDIGSSSENNAGNKSKSENLAKENTEKSKKSLFRMIISPKIYYPAMIVLFILAWVAGKSKSTEDIDLAPVLKDYYIRHMADGTFVSWLAMDGDEIIGTSGMSFVEKPPYFGCPSGRIGLLSSMFTNPNYRRKGIAKELLSRVVNEAKEYGCGTVQITASDMGVKLYTDFGFKHNDNFMHYKL